MPLFHHILLSAGSHYLPFSYSMTVNVRAFNIIPLLEASVLFAKCSIVVLLADISVILFIVVMFVLLFPVD